MWNRRASSMPVVSSKRPTAGSPRSRRARGSVPSKRCGARSRDVSASLRATTAVAFRSLRRKRNIMQIVFVLFDRFTALDAIGPYEVLQRLPGAEVVFAAKEAGVYRTDTKRLGIVADAPLSDVAR